MRFLRSKSVRIKFFFKINKKNVKKKKNCLNDNISRPKFFSHNCYCCEEKVDSWRWPLVIVCDGRVGGGPRRFHICWDAGRLRGCCGHHSKAFCGLPSPSISPIFPYFSLFSGFFFSFLLLLYHID